MVHHSIAVVITSFLTNFSELRKAEVQLLRIPQPVEKLPLCPSRPQIGPQTHRIRALFGPLKPDS